MRVELPYKWAPRDYQEAAWFALEGGCKRVDLVWHRRAGKDLFGLNWLATQAVRRRGLYWHMFPTYSQGRKVAWEGMDRAGRPFLDAFPPELSYRKLDQEMTLYLHGGSQYQVVGTDHMDRLVGANPVGVIMSEYAIQNPAAWDFLRPILAENGGWAIFAYTPRGRNHGYRLYKQALTNPNWFAQLLTVDDTGAVPPEMIEEDRMSGMSEPMIQQEYYCLPSGTPIFTDSGQRPIETISPGDRVMGHSGRWRSVLETMQRPSHGELVEIQTYGNRERLRLTGNHEVRVLIPESQEYIWRPAADIKKGDWLVMPRMRLGPQLVPVSLATLAAWYVAEGSNAKTCVEFSFGHDEHEFAEEVVKCANALGSTAKVSKIRTGLSVQVRSTRLSDALATRCGSMSYMKHIPWDYVSGHEELFFDRLMKGDGCEVANGWMYTTTSESLAYDVQALASSLGYTSGITTRPGGVAWIEGRMVSVRPSFALRIARTKNGTKIRAAKNGVGVRVRNVRTVPHSGNVYNLKVQYDESYVAAGRTVHNCSFNAALVGSYYGDVIGWMEEQKPPRITSVAHDESQRVYTGWDIGRRDSTAIWFAQIVAREFRLIDYFEAAGEDPSHYVRAMEGRLEGSEHRKRYIYSHAYLPHDARARSLATRLTVEEQLRSLGVDVRVSEKFPVEDQHAAVRKQLRETWIDEIRCERGLQALREYVKQPIADLQGPNNETIYRNEPLHNWASHGASALATLVLNFQPGTIGRFTQPSTEYVV